MNPCSGSTDSYTFHLQHRMQGSTVHGHCSTAQAARQHVCHGMCHTCPSHAAHPLLTLPMVARCKRCGYHCTIKQVPTRMDSASIAYGPDSHSGWVTVNACISSITLYKGCTLEGNVTYVWLTCNTLSPIKRPGAAQHSIAHSHNTLLLELLLDVYSLKLQLAALTAALHRLHLQLAAPAPALDLSFDAHRVQLQPAAVRLQFGLQLHQIKMCQCW